MIHASFAAPGSGHFVSFASNLSSFFFFGRHANSSGRSSSAHVASRLMLLLLFLMIVMILEIVKIVEIVMMVSIVMMMMMMIVLQRRMLTLENARVVVMTLKILSLGGGRL